MIRSHIIAEKSLVEAGLWQAVWHFSELYLGLITMFLGVYFFPKISSLVHDHHSARSEVWHVVKFVAPIAAVICFGAYLFRDLVIFLLYSNEFKEAKNLFFYQVLGDYLKILSWIFGYYMLAKEMVKLVVSATIISNVFFVGASYFFIAQSGIEGVTYAHAINYAIYLIFTFLIFRFTT